MAIRAEVKNVLEKRRKVRCHHTGSEPQIGMLNRAVTGLHLLVFEREENN